MNDKPVLAFLAVAIILYSFGHSSYIIELMRVRGNEIRNSFSVVIKLILRQELIATYFIRQLRHCISNTFFVYTIVSVVCDRLFK